MRVSPIVLMVMLLASSIPAFAPTATAQPSAAWWDPPEVKGPQDYQDGWNFRVPLRVDNPWDYAITRTHPISVELEMNRLAAEAGWLQTTAAGEQVARSFTFDLDSVRLVEYKPNWAGIDAPVPVVVDAIWLEPDQTDRFGKVQNQDFDPRTNPVITLTWFPDTPIVPGSAAYYFVYFEATENSEKEPIELSRDEQERFDVAGWTGRGTELWGHSQGSITPNVEVQSLHPGTEVTVYEYRRGFPRPTLRDIHPLSNPFVLADSGDRQAFVVSPSDAPFKIEADKPVLVSNSEAPRRISEFVPSTDSGLTGTHFVFAVPTHQGGPTAPTVPFFYMGRTSAGTTAINVQVVETDDQGNTNSRTLQINSLQGFVQDGLTQGSDVEITSDNPIVIQPRPFGEQYGLHQVPSIDYGSAYGRNIYAASTHGGGLGTWRLSSMDDVAHPSVFSLPPGQRVYPDSGSPLVPMVPGLPGLLTLQLPVPGFPAGAPESSLPHYIWSTNSEDVPADQRGPISARIGWGSQDVAPIGGHESRHFIYRGPVAVFAHYDGTVVSHLQAGQQTTFLLTGDGHRQLDAPVTQWQELHSNKPLTVVPILDAADGDDGYTRWMAGRLAPPPVAVLTPEFRGFLVQVRSPDGADPIFQTTKPGRPVTIPIEVTNLGRWIGGVPLSDTVHLTAAPQSGWAGTATWAQSGSSSATAVLASAASSTLDLVLAPPADAIAGTAISVAVIATSDGNPNLNDRIQILLLVEQGFGVKMWWEAGGSTTQTDITRSLDAGATRTYRAFLENTGTGVDSYQVSTTAASLGWGVRVQSPSQPGHTLTRVADVQPDEVRPIDVVVEAPASTDQEAQTQFIMQAFSESSASTAGLLQAVFQLNLRRDVAIEAAIQRLTVLPGASVEFPLRLANSGENSATIAVEILDDLPDGWNARLDGIPGSGQTGEITLIPTQEHEFIVNVTASADARYGEFVPALIQASLADTDASGENAVSILVLVGRTIDLTATTPPQLEAAPGDKVSIDVNVTHRGNSEANVTLMPVDLPAGWTTSSAPSRLLASPADADDSISRTFTINVTIPLQTLAGTYTLGLQAVQLEGGAVELEIQVDVAEHLDAAVDGPDQPVPIGPNETVMLPVVLRNQGNAPLGLQASTTPPPGWAVTLSPSAAEVAPGTNRTIMVAVTAPHRDDPRAHTITISINDVRRGATETVRWDMQYGLPDVEIVSVTLGANAARIEGDVLFLTAIVANHGDATAAGVPLQLFVDGQVVDQVSLGSVAPNGSVFATLQMAWPGHIPTIEVVANPSEALAETDYANNAFVLDAADVLVDPTPNVPAPSFIFLLFAAVVVALHHRRRFV